MAVKSLVQQFLDDLGNDRIMVFEADFLPLLVLVDWLRSDIGNIRDVYPFFCIKKGRKTKAYANLTKYHGVPKAVFAAFLAGGLHIDERNTAYKEVCARIDTLYESQYPSQEWSEAELVERLQEAYKLLQDLVTLTLFLDTLDQQAIEEVLKETNSNIQLDAVWQASHLQDFESFDAKNNREIVSAIREKQGIGRLQHVFTNYTHVASIEEVEEVVVKIDINQKEAELHKNEEQIKQHRDEKATLKKTLSDEQQTILTFIDWSAWLRDDRKAFINKSDVLFFNSVAALYQQWGVSQELVELSLVHEVLQGKEYILSNIDVIRRRKEKMIMLYYGDERYIEDSTQSEEEIQLLEKRLAAQHGQQQGQSIKGEVACKGAAKGRVRIVLTQSEFDSFQEGEVLVTSMTRPEFVPLMKKAVAIITDEGGITSHAAIVSRELKKPCIIGTRIATRILQNGDEVELDTTTGIVKVV